MIPNIKIRQSHNCLIFIMEIPISGKTVFILTQRSAACADLRSSLIDLFNFYPVMSKIQYLINVYLWFWLLTTNLYPSALRAGGVLSSRSRQAGGRAGDCQTCGTHISVTAWWIFSIRSSVELSRPVGVHCHGHMPICHIWGCPWAKNLSNCGNFYHTW